VLCPQPAAATATQATAKRKILLVLVLVLVLDFPLFIEDEDENDDEDELETTFFTHALYAASPWRCKQTLKRAEARAPDQIRLWLQNATNQ